MNISKQSKIWSNRKNVDIWYAFFTCAIIATIIIFPFVVMNGGILTMCEDFNAETIPYLYYIHDTIYSGEFGWSWFFDLGGDAVQSLSSIGGFNITTLINALFPRDMIIYALPWFVVLRYSLMGTGAYLYIHRYVRNQNIALIGAILYAFSGYSACVLVFNFINDAFVIFPFTLWALDGLVLDKRRAVFAFTIFITALGSPSTLVMEIFFFATYYLIRYLFEDIHYLRDCVSCIVEGILGIAMASASFIPQAMILLNNNRLSSDKLYGSSSLTFSSTDILLWLRALILPAETMSNSTSVVSADWTSNAAYLPMVGITLLIAFVWRNQKIWIRRMVIAELVISLVPFLNNMFMLEMGCPYRRWYAFGLLILALASAVVMNDIADYPITKAAIVSSVLIISYALIVYLVPWYGTERLPVHSPRRFLFRIVFSLLGIAITTLLLVCSEKNLSKYRIKLLIISMMSFAVISNAIVLQEYKKNSLHAIQDNKTSQVLNELENTGRVLRNKDILPYRVVFANDYYNYGMMHHYPARITFVSLVSPSIEKFYSLLGTARGTISPWGPNGTNSLLSTKFFFMEGLNDNLELEVQYNNGNREVYLYKDKLALPIGFTYDSFITEDELCDTPEEIRAAVALKNLVVSDKDVNLVDDSLIHDDDFVYDTPVPESELNRLKLNHKIEAGTDFSYDSYHFKTTIQSSKSKYAFFSVPYSSEWTAEINGEKVHILDSLGMMAIPINEGINEIIFTYHPRTSTTSFALSFLFIIIWLIYWQIGRKERG